MSKKTVRASLAAVASMVALSASAVPALDATRLQTGRFQHRTVVDGKAAGESRMEIQPRGDGHYVFTNLVTGAFTQSWEAVTTREFKPVAAKLVFGAGSDARPSFELAYKGDRVTGFAFSRTQPPVKRLVDETVLADTVDQRIDWAAVMAIDDVAPGREFSFHVYDPATQNSPITVQIKGVETTRVPAGTYETIRMVYRIEKAGKSETYELLATLATPRFMVKETFPNGASTELVAVLPK